LIPRVAAVRSHSVEPLQNAQISGDNAGSCVDELKNRDLNSGLLARASGAVRSISGFRGVLEVNKQELIGVVAATTGLSKGDATKAVDGVFDAITAALKKNEEVRLVGFGTFHVATRAASEGRNPRTGEPLKIPASKQPKFKAGKGLKDSLN
jgi:DNA-binding protein HU-beta